MAYGLQVYGPNGSSVVFDENLLFSRLSYSENYSVGKAVSGTQPTVKTYSWPGASNREKYQIIAVPFMTNDILSASVPTIVLSANSFTLTNYSTVTSARGYLYILRRI